MYKASVVIPVYNVENYIVQYAESLFEQTFDDIQFIFVDDASPDDSVRRLEQTLNRFPQRKKQTVILHHARDMGLPTARATGLKYAEAPYVAHCDSDDYVEPNMYEKLYECAIRNGSDLVICARKVYFDGKKFTDIDRPLTKNNYIHDFLSGRISPYVWPRLTKTDIYRRVRFPTENYLEDWVQTAQLLTYASRITFLDDCLYHHVRNPFSITNDKRPDVRGEKLQQCITNYHLMHDFITEHHRVEERMFALRKEIRRRFFPLINRKQYLQTFPELNFSILFYGEFSWRYKASHILILLGLFPFARAIYGLIRQPLSGIRPKPVAASASFASTGMPVSEKQA